jgi:hypothetical protein
MFTKYYFLDVGIYKHESSNYLKCDWTTWTKTSLLIVIATIQ